MINKAFHVSFGAIEWKNDILPANSYMILSQSCQIYDTNMRGELGNPDPRLAVQQGFVQDVIQGSVNDSSLIVQINCKIHFLSKLLACVFPWTHLFFFARQLYLGLIQDHTHQSVHFVHVFRTNQLGFNMFIRSSWP